MIMNIDALNCNRLLMLYMSNLTGKRYMMTKRFMDLCEVLRTTAMAVPVPPSLKHYELLVFVEDISSELADSFTNS